MSSVTPIRPGGDGANPAQDEKSMPSREVLEKRLENEEERLCQASNILDVIALLLDSRDQGDDHVIWGTLRVAHNLLGEAISGIAPMYLLKIDRDD